MDIAYTHTGLTKVKNPATFCQMHRELLREEKKKKKELNINFKKIFNVIVVLFSLYLCLCTADGDGCLCSRLYVNVRKAEGGRRDQISHCGVNFFVEFAILSTQHAHSIVLSPPIVGL